MLFGSWWRTLSSGLTLTFGVHAARVLLPLKKRGTNLRQTTNVYINFAFPCWDHTEWYLSGFTWYKNMVPRPVHTRRIFSAKICSDKHFHLNERLLICLFRLNMNIHILSVWQIFLWSGVLIFFFFYHTLNKTGQPMRFKLLVTYPEPLLLHKTKAWWRLWAD